ncbi:hypothetical protein E2C01_031364 [Portunus trituberculatus]|uniref:Uncharacterized protein n=1 Tax=Portunus trituberculatus TaxID=210409 RepID=A0A5B7EXX6_PORTR|nr:hypothetical protein [Portunus trituberculatus]
MNIPVPLRPRSFRKRVAIFYQGLLPRIQIYHFAIDRLSEAGNKMRKKYSRINSSLTRTAMRVVCGGSGSSRRPRIKTIKRSRLEFYLQIDYLL